jgi:hypothetical protein
MIDGLCSRCRQENGLHPIIEHDDAKGRCRKCKRPMTWAAQRVQYGRLKRKGVPDEQIKAIVPQCQKCITALLASMKGGKP